MRRHPFPAGSVKAMITNTRRRGQRGAVTIHVAVALMALIVFTSFVIDYGVLWVSRRQAQNVADAGALAGAVAFIYQGNDDAARGAAHHFAAINQVWGEGNSPANVDVTLSGTGTSIPPCGEEPGCVRVDVFRNMPDRAGTLRGNALPTYFLNMVGVGAQGIRATATAQTANGNAINCLLPFAVIDRWADNFDEKKDPTYYPNDGLTGTAGWSPNDRYQPENLGFSPDPDVYIGPYDNNPNHTGWTVDGDYGRQLVVKAGDIGDYSTGWAQRVDLPGSTGASDYNYNILNCNPTPVGIATNPVGGCDPAPGGATMGREIEGCVSVSTGMAQGPTVQNGINVLVANDPNLYWNPGVTGPSGRSGAPVDATTGAIRFNSMRVRPIVVFDIKHYIDSGCTGTNCIGKVANIIGFFIEGTCAAVHSAGGLVGGNWAQCENPNKDIVGRIVTIPGQFVVGTGEVADNASFVQVVRLVR